ncbi:MAG: KEOPS complex subunit Pcc1 [Candidatus Bathyarchaeia archaeon]
MEERSARTVAEAIAVDNRPAPAGLSIETTVEERTVVTTIRSSARLETFIATVDDLLESIQVAERTIQALKQERPKLSQAARRRLGEASVISEN